MNLFDQLYEYSDVDDTHIEPSFDVEPWWLELDIESMAIDN